VAIDAAQLDGIANLKCFWSLGTRAT